MGFWMGFAKAMGDDIEHNNMLDLENERLMRQQHGDHLWTMMKDPRYEPIIPQLMQEYQTLRSTPLTKKYKSNIDKILSTPIQANKGVPATGQNISYPSAPKEEGGPADYSNMFSSPAKPIAGEPGIAGMRAPYYSNEELGQQEARDAGLKAGAVQDATLSGQIALAQARSYGNMIGGAIPMTAEDVKQYYGIDMPPGSYQVRERKGMAPEILPISESFRFGSTPQWDPNQGRWVMPRENVRTGDVSGAQSDLEPAPPGLRHFYVTDGQGGWYTIQLDPRNQQYGPAQRVAAPTSMTGYEYAHDQIVDFGDRKERVRVYSQRTPNAQQPSITPQPPAGALQVGAPNIPPPPAAGKPAAQPGAAPASGITPGPRLPNRSSAAAFNSPEARIKALGEGKSTYTGGTAEDGSPLLDLTNANFTPPRDQLFTPDMTPGERNGMWRKGPTPMTWQQMEKFRANDATYEITLDYLNKALAYSDVLNKPLDALKMEMLVSTSKTKQFAARALFKPGSREIQFADAYISLREHIQKMRGPLGAAGFRSLEAFLSLQAQRGDLLMQPQITQNVLRNSMKTFLSLLGVDRRTLADNAKQLNIPTVKIRNLYKAAYAPADDAGITEMIESMYADGYHKQTK